MDEPAVAPGTESSRLPIGDFARATQLSIKTLRHYHRIGLLEPATVDDATGYRYYGAEQIPAAQVIRRFRALDMPIEEIRSVLAADDPVERTELISGHLSRLEDSLGRTQAAVASLRNLLQPSSPRVAEVRHRREPACRVAAITQVIDRSAALTWLQGASGELHATVAAQGLESAGPGGGVYSDELITGEGGEATVFVPCERPVRPVGRVVAAEIPAAELATILHEGAIADIDRAYGALAEYVARHALAVNGPIREYYLVGMSDTRDESRWRTEVCWPIFDTRQRAQPPADRQSSAGPAD